MTSLHCVNRDRATSVGFYSAVVAVVSGLAAWGYWDHRENELRSPVESLGRSLVPFWILVGIAVFCVAVSVSMWVALWVTDMPDQFDP